MSIFDYEEPGSHLVPSEIFVPRVLMERVDMLEKIADGLREALAATNKRVTALENDDADRAGPIKIIPPTIIQGGQPHGRP